MRGVLVRWVLNALALLFTAAVLPGVHVGGVVSAFFAAALLGIVNAFIRPVLLLLTLPINIMTLGLFTLVINGLMLQLVASVVKGVEIEGFGWAILGSVVLGITSWVINALIGGRGRVEIIELRRRRDGIWEA